MSFGVDQTVKVKLPGADPIPAAIEQVEESLVTIALLVKAHQPLQYFRERAASLEYADGKGLHKLACVVVHEAPGDRLVLRRDPLEDLLQRRDWFRVEAFVPLTVVTREDPPRTLETTSHDLSGGGMLIADPVALPSGTELDIAMKLGPGDPVRVTAKVVRNTGNQRTAVQILEIERADRQELQRYITERQRAALRVAKGG